MGPPTREEVFILQAVSVWTYLYILEHFFFARNLYDITVKWAHHDFPACWEAPRRYLFVYFSQRRGPYHIILHVISLITFYFREDHIFCAVWKRLRKDIIFCHTFTKTYKKLILKICEHFSNFGWKSLPMHDVTQLRHCRPLRAKHLLRASVFEPWLWFIKWQSCIPWHLCSVKHVECSTTVDSQLHFNYNYLPPCIFHCLFTVSAFRLWLTRSAVKLSRA